MGMLKMLPKILLLLKIQSLFLSKIREITYIYPSISLPHLNFLLIGNWITTLKPSWNIGTIKYLTILVGKGLMSYCSIHNIKIGINFLIEKLWLVFYLNWRHNHIILISYVVLNEYSVIIDSHWCQVISFSQ